MDVERRRDEAKLGAGRKPRLMEESELPDWLLREEDEVDRWDLGDDEERYYGRGSRHRKEVDYSDSLTEKEWLKVIGAVDEEGLEEDGDDKKGRRRRKKRGRFEDEEEDLLLSKRRRLKFSEGGGGDSRERKGYSRLKRKMRKILEVIITYRDSDGRVLSEPFMKLPSRRELPDYYEVIKKPLDIKKILTRIEDEKYTELDDLERDFMQLCKNAQAYNEEASLIYDDSIVLQSVFSDARKRLEKEEKEKEREEPEEPEEDTKGLVDYDDEEGGSEDDTSIKMKIKLKKKSGSGNVSASTSTSGNGNGNSHTGQDSSRPKRKRLKRYVSDEEDEIDDDV
jgi:SWI/SNF-related matrix-associated actin-dependent regulator of chromatin subfamily A protein 2/4